MIRETAIKLFESKKVRSVWDTEKGKWYFSIIDVVEILTDSPNPRDYWYRIKQREKISGVELSTICRQFKLAAQDGKLRVTECSDTRMFPVTDKRTKLYLTAQNRAYCFS